jgi:hypothetical protein
MLNFILKEIFHEAGHFIVGGAKGKTTMADRFIRG